ncbi:MAG: PfkB family carbohydrate kinase [Methylobacter tundripaludum]|uniref:Sulfofructose kinase n=1 Tax=Methylobacter tundripaludum TaxID=173365 RepID=A0A2S6GZZ9_9GAMM|nr:PfkB family carbohydrate kinase [Methylobacter tundripaludum]MCK9634666.1 PfkB family carbohydrate kinase [Methylobacter tundripaludum]PPK70788.1 sulfofructose kinase [Methylobacter tundripaludum]
MPQNVDVLCVGHASYDLIFSVSRHPDADEKVVADNLLGCGGGPAANAAVCIARLGLTSAFAGYLGRDLYGDKHFQELNDEGVDTQLIIRGASPTPLSAILVKPDGKRCLINYKGDTQALPADALNLAPIPAKVVLFDGHEPFISLALAEQARQSKIPTVLDAGSVHDGTLALMNRVDYLVCSEKFAVQYAGDEHKALSRLAALAPTVVITLGERGLVWQRGNEQGALSAYPVTAIDTTGAGDAFHGAFAAALAAGLEWQALLRYASAAGSLCCTKMGARLGLPSRQEHARLFNRPLF